MNYLGYILLMCSFSFTAFASDKLVIGTLSNAPPFEFRNEAHNLSGFDIDLITDICKRIKKECVFKLYNFHKLFNALHKGEIDLAIAAIMITPERKKEVLFSFPYKLIMHQYLTLASSKVDTVAQLRNKIIGIYGTSPEEDVIDAQFKGDIKIKTYEHVNQMIDALQKNNVEAVLLEYHRAIYWLSNTQGFKLLGRPFQSGEGYGIAAKLGRTDLIQQVNEALMHIEKDGTYLRLYKTYF